MNTSVIAAASHAPTEEIDGFWVRLYFLSRDPSVLVGIAGGIFAIAVLLAWLLRAPERPERGSRDEGILVRQELALADPDVSRVLTMMPRLAERSAETKQFGEVVAKAAIPEAAKESVMAYWQSLLTDTGDSTGALLWAAHRFHPAQYANEALGDLYATAQATDRALSCYLREVHLFDSDASRGKLVELLLHNKRYGALHELRDAPGFAHHLTPMIRLRMELERRDWRAVGVELMTVERELMQPMPLTLALIGALAWLAIALQAIQPQNWFGVRVIMPLLAVLAGVAAALAASLAAIWMEDLSGLRPTGEFLNDLAFYFGSVAPREELLKLLFVLPFMPALLARRSHLEALIVSGCVGLGFATEGLLQAFQSVGLTDSFGRFLTAHFFHFAGTGLCGLALYEFLESPRQKGLALVAVLFGVTLAHGAYDCFMAVQGLRILSLASIVNFLALSFVWVRRLQQLRDGRTDQLFLSATLLAGTSLVTGFMLVCGAMQLGFVTAVIALAANAIGLVTIVVFFCREFAPQLTDEETESHYIQS